MTRASQFAVLVVEDEAVVAMELTSRLTDFGYRVLGPAATAEHALRLVDREVPDLLLADIRLRNGDDGVALASTLRNRFGVPTFYLSAHSDRATVERALAADPFGFLTKPVRESDLRASLQAALRRAHLEKQLARRERELSVAHARAEQALAATRESEARFRAVVEGSPDAILVVAQDGKVVMANASAARLFDDRNGELCGREVEQLMTTSLREAHRSLRKTFFEAPEARMMGARSAVYTRNRKGVDVPLEIALSTLDIGGEPYALVIARDVSQRKQHEEQIAKLQKLDALGRLAAGVAHDFNNMVTVILALSGLLEPMLFDRPAASVLVRDMREASERAGALTRQLLTFAQRSPVEALQVDLNEEIRSFSGLLQRTLDPQCTLELDLDTQPCRATLDPTHLQQVLLNLVVNARDAMPQGGTVLLRTRSQQHSPTKRVGARLDVKDTGHGMTEEVKSRLFEPLFTTKVAGEGTGLGLSTVYGIVTQAGGELSAESELGVGSCFSIWFPEVFAELGSASPAPTS